MTQAASVPTAEQASALALDAGGTGCRWSLCSAGGGLIDQGSLPAIEGAMALDEAGRAQAFEALLPLGRAMGARPPPTRVWVGITGLDPEHAGVFARLIGRALGLNGPGALDRVQVVPDIELACQAAFAPGQGMVLVAGTGAIAGFVDGQGQWHRAGGRGVLIDDAGGGHWIATQALRSIWRAEDASPGAWRSSALARQLLDRLGGADWAHTRRFMVSAGRGEVGRLALAVAEAAASDPAARALLHQAGVELARPAQALMRRFGQRPLALVGRVWDLHPAVIEGLTSQWPDGLDWHRQDAAVSLLAARRAAAAPWPGADPARLVGD